MNQKMKGLKDFPIIDAYTILSNNELVLECNHCDFTTPSDTEMENHYNRDHTDLRDATWPKKQLEPLHGKTWLIPIESTVEHAIHQINDYEYYIKFYGDCSREEQPLSPEELKHVTLDTSILRYIYKEHTEKSLPIPKKTSIKPKSKSKKKKHVYSLNVGKAKLQSAKEKIIREYNVEEQDIITKENKNGNYAMFYMK